jgi:hypothetical protein
MKKVLSVLTILTILIFSTSAIAGGGKAKSKFYDFSDQLIDGTIAKPQAMVNDVKGKVKFDRLLRLKKSFMPSLLQTAKERVFK